jgi:hypothetical protein
MRGPAWVVVVRPPGGGPPAAEGVGRRHGAPFSEDSPWYALVSQWLKARPMLAIVKIIVVCGVLGLLGLSSCQGDRLNGSAAAALGEP